MIVLFNLASCTCTRLIFQGSLYSEWWFARDTYRLKLLDLIPVLVDSFGAYRNPILFRCILTVCRTDHFVIDSADPDVSVPPSHRDCTDFFNFAGPPFNFFHWVGLLIHGSFFTILMKRRKWCDGDAWNRLPEAPKKQRCRYAWHTPPPAESHHRRSMFRSAPWIRRGCRTQDELVTPIDLPEVSLWDQSTERERES